MGARSAALCVSIAIAGSPAAARAQSASQIGKPSTFRVVVQYTDHKKFTVESRITSLDVRP